MDNTSSAVPLEFFIEPFPHEDTGTGTIGISELQYQYRFWRYEFDASSNRILYRITRGFGGPVLEFWCLHVEGDSSSSPLAVISFSQRHERNATYPQRQPNAYVSHSIGFFWIFSDT